MLAFIGVAKIAERVLYVFLIRYNSTTNRYYMSRIENNYIVSFRSIFITITATDPFKASVSKSLIVLASLSCKATRNSGNGYFNPRSGRIALFLRLGYK